MIPAAREHETDIAVRCFLGKYVHAVYSVR